MPQVRVDYDHGEDKWQVTKNSSHVSWHRKKSRARGKGEKVAEDLADKHGYATLEIHNRTSPGSELVEFGSRGFP